MLNYGRIILVLAIIGIGILGYFYFKDYRQEIRRAEYIRYAGVIAETSVAAEIYRYHPDSFLVARDSILKKFELTLADMEAFKDKYIGNEPRWAEFWVYLDSLTDSIIHFYDSTHGGSLDSLVTPEDSLIDEKGPIGILRNRPQAVGQQGQTDSALFIDPDTVTPDDDQEPGN